MIWTYLTSILVLLLIGLLFLRLRVSCQINSEQKQLYAGLGRSGVLLDWTGQTGAVQLFGAKIKSFALKKEKVEPREATDKESLVDKKPKTTRRRPDLKESISLALGSLQPLWHWFISLLRATKIEQLEGRFRGGFDSPDLTGQAYGYYQAMLGSVPAMADRVTYEPTWTEAGFEADLKGSVTLPLYSLVGRTIQLAWALPLRKLIKLAIGTKKPKR